MHVLGLDLANLAYGYGSPGAVYPIPLEERVTPNNRRPEADDGAVAESRAQGLRPRLQLLQNGCSVGRPFPARAAGQRCRYSEYRREAN